MELLAGFNRRGQTVLLATHEVELARRYARRVINLRDGKLTADSETNVREPGGAG